MHLLRYLDARSAGRGPFVAAIGGFDGIHRGHRALIARAREIAARERCASMVLTFEPLPKEFFAAELPPARLTNLRERCRLLQQDGPEALCVLRFDDSLRRLCAADFAQRLADGGVRAVVVGHDFRAGYGGEASVAWFRDNAARTGIAVDVVDPVLDADVRIGSGVIRHALSAGDLAGAARLLGRAYSMRGRVVTGDRLGRTLGFPTANLRLARRRTPVDGIFAVRVHGIEAGRPLGGVASLGTRPTVGGRVPLLETHVFDFAGDIYGREIEVEFVARLRDELRFDDVETMVDQMHRDAAAARAHLAA